MGIPEMVFDEDVAVVQEGRQPSSQAGRDGEGVPELQLPSWRAALGARSIEEQVAPI